jgi:dTDP-4-dehydrorhamnose reductase
MANLKIHKSKVMIFGANGLLGQKLVAAFSDKFEVAAVGRKPRPRFDSFETNYFRADIIDRAKVRSLVRENKPKLIINAAAYADVDGCEINREECWNVNVKGVENIAQAANSIDARLIHISSDYLFDGQRDVAVSEDASPNPINYYGRSKLAGENAVIATGADHAIIRTMILYGVGRNLRHNLVTRLIEKLSLGESLQIADDRFGHPTLADDLAKAIRRVAELQKSGVLHICGPDYLSRYDFAVRIAKIFGRNVDFIQPTNSSNLKQTAPRPLYAHFDLTKARQELGIELCGVDEGLKILKHQLQTVKT